MVRAGVCRLITCHLVPHEVHALIAGALERAYMILVGQRAILETLAHLLMQKETIAGDELRALMQAIH
jgi:ATP-dependent Zn protease